ncbi:hypothetical protein SCA6_009705 [Theobroma cacao]
MVKLLIWNCRPERLLARIKNQDRKKKGHEVLIQGGVIDDVARHLVEQYGIPKRYIEFLDKTRK